MATPIFSKKLIQIWNDWELRVLVLLSMSWQIILIIFGSRRKYTRGSWISFLVWLTYLSADWLATVALGTLAKGNQACHPINLAPVPAPLGTPAYSPGDPAAAGESVDPNNLLLALWAPFLLLHLGGPDAITAYSLEDNSLWLRHLLGLVVQVVVAFYVYLRSWTNSPFTFVAIPVFISGIIKYAERTWVLRSASPQQFEDSLISESTRPALDLKGVIDGSEDLHRAYFLFSMFKHLFADLGLSFGEGQQCYSTIVSQNNPRDFKRAFKLVEVQLGFMYDVLYTKTTIVHSRLGYFLRSISFLSSISAFVAFSSVIYRSDHHAHASFEINIIITYVLLIGAIFLEVYAAIALLFSDWTMLWLTKHKNMFGGIYGAMSSLQSILIHKKWWSNSIAQHNLMNFCLKNKAAMYVRVELLFSIYFMFEKYWSRTWKDVDHDHYNLKELIFLQFQEKHKTYKEKGYDFQVLKEVLAHRGDNVLEKYGCLEKLSWSVTGVEFDHSLLLWHIATDICNNISTPEQNHYNNRARAREASNSLSDYMYYILLMRPLMLPKWIDRIRHLRDTNKEAIAIFHRTEFKERGKEEACKMLLEMHTQSRPLEMMRREKRSQSVFFDGCRLAKQLLEMGVPWEMMSDVWVEMLIYAATHCGWKDHAQRLRSGGELLAHVCLLGANLGLSEQFQIRKLVPASEGNQLGWGWGKSGISSCI